MKLSPEIARIAARAALIAELALLGCSGKTPPPTPRPTLVPTPTELPKPCQNEGEIIGAIPEFVDARQTDGKKESTGRIYLIENQPDSGIYTLELEPGFIKPVAGTISVQAGINIHLKTEIRRTGGPNLAGEGVLTLRSGSLSQWNADLVEQPNSCNILVQAWNARGFSPPIFWNGQPVTTARFIRSAVPSLIPSPSPNVSLTEAAVL